MYIISKEFLQKQLRRYFLILQLNSKYILIDRKIRFPFSGTRIFNVIEL